ncbi:MAG TPA: hypothetical protein VFU60_17780 [Ktedonobacterales bacterium]|nr:hypothetical protein [Ktedonobacterales bacterium]
MRRMTEYQPVAAWSPTDGELPVACASEWKTAQSPYRGGMSENRPHHSTDGDSVPGQINNVKQ